MEVENNTETPVNVSFYFTGGFSKLSEYRSCCILTFCWENPNCHVDLRKKKPQNKTGASVVRSDIISVAVVSYTKYLAVMRS